jgi:cell division protein FtsN
VFASRRKGSLFTSGPDRWLVLAGAGLLVLGLVLRLLTDIGRSTAAGDTAAPVADMATPEASAPGVPTLPITTAETLAASPAAREPAPAAVPKAAQPKAPSAATRSAAGPAPTKTAPAAASDAAGWGVQLGAFGNRANAERLRSRVQVLGYRTDVIEAGTLARVRVSGLADRAAAEAAADSISRALGTRGVVVGPGR